MGKPLTSKQFFREWAKLIPGAKPSPQTLDKYYDALVKLIHNELQTHGEIWLINIGTLYTKMYAGREVDNPLYGLTYIPPHLYPAMTFSDSFRERIRHEQPYYMKSERAKQRKQEAVEIERTDEEKRAEVIKLLNKKAKTGDSMVDIYDNIKRKEREQRKKRKNGKTSE